MTSGFPSFLNRLLLRLLCGLALSLPVLSLGAPGQSVRTSGANAPGVSVKKGGAIFQQRCVVCHNKRPEDNSPFGPPNLYAAFRGTPALGPKEAETIVVNGKGQMPAFGAILTRSEIRSVIAYLRTH